MNTSEKLKIIQQLSGLTQTRLAIELGVSHPTFNSWINEKSKPHASKIKKIDILYQKYSGQAPQASNGTIAKKEIIIKKSQSHKNLISFIKSRTDLYDQLVLSFTYNTNSIEGSTLTENETADILFEGLTIRNKDFVEHLEAKNHQMALDYLFDQISLNSKIKEDFILKLHKILMNGIRNDAGLYRKHGVRIVGSNVPTANHLKVATLIKELIRDINMKEEDIVSHVSLIHSRFEKIHPFSDGNGRVGRLLMAAMLLKKNMAPAIIQKQKKRDYYKFLRNSQLKNEHAMLEDFICDSILNGYKLLED